MTQNYFSFFSIKRWGLIFLGALILLLLTAASAKASGNISITRALPDPNSKNNTWFNFVAQPGKTIEDSVLIKNLGPSPVKVKIFAIDSKTNRAGRFIPKLENDTQNTIGKWTTLETSIAELGPHQSLPVKFSIDIPSELAAGEYAGGIVVEEIKTPDCDPEFTDCIAGSVITTRIGNRIYVKIPGNTEHKLEWQLFKKREDQFHLRNLFNNEQYFEFKLQNKGNTVVRPNIVIDIYDGNTPQTKIKKILGEFQPTAVSEPIIKWEDSPMFGKFTAKAQLFITETQSITKEITFWVIPWEMFLTLTIIFLVVLVFFVTYKIAQKSNIDLPSANKPKKKA